jgi:hypothetical protein
VQVTIDTFWRIPTRCWSRCRKESRRLRPTRTRSTRVEAKKRHCTIVSHSCCWKMKTFTLTVWDAIRKKVYYDERIILFLSQDHKCLIHKTIKTICLLLKSFSFCQNNNMFDENFRAKLPINPSLGVVKSSNFVTKIN